MTTHAANGSSCTLLSVTQGTPCAIAKGSMLGLDDRLAVNNGVAQDCLIVGRRACPKTEIEKRNKRPLLHLVTHSTFLSRAERTEQADKTQLTMVAGVAVGSRVQILATKVKAEGWCKGRWPKSEWLTGTVVLKVNRKRRVRWDNASIDDTNVSARSLKFVVEQGNVGAAAALPVQPAEMQGEPEVPAGAGVGAAAAVAASPAPAPADAAGVSSDCSCASPIFGSPFHWHGQKLYQTVSFSIHAAA